MNSPRARRDSRGGFTLLEMLIALSISSVALAGISVASVTLRRSFEAADYRMTAQNDQLRVLDYLSRDLHMAAAVSLLNGNKQDGFGKVILTLPPETPGLLDLSLGPLVSSLGGSTAATGKTVSYYVEGGQFIREADGSQNVVAGTVADVRFRNSGQYLTTSVVFTPQFCSSPTAAAQENTRVGSHVFLRNAPVVK